jgi:hypothetical protein
MSGKCAIFLADHESMEKSENIRMHLNIACRKQYITVSKLWG